MGIVRSAFLGNLSVGEVSLKLNTTIQYPQPVASISALDVKCTRHKLLEKQLFNDLLMLFICLVG